ncbi:MAG: ATP-binding cassette domain-containing protein [Oscillospiraceae bacterium]|jgi:energy-coupling factor transport system ATP-binding protein|nr:ATP-binding cassette domain-containing protein [Oscillospiraceae bacterium]
MIKIQGLTFTYKDGARPALAGLELDIRDGEFVGIIGSCGAGKSTLTYALNGVVPHHYTGDMYGSVTVEGLDTVESSPEEISRYVGSVFQDVDGQMVSAVVEDEVLFGMENFGVPRSEIESRLEQALAEAGISELRHRATSTLSGGQKQKVAIAAIIALRPKIIVLDEPTGELDPRSSRRVFDTLRELNENHGITIVVVEQKIMLLCEYVKRLLLMDGGRVVLDGAVGDVLRQTEVFETAGVNIPRVATLARELTKLGYYSGATPTGLAQAETMMREVLGNG